MTERTETERTERVRGHHTYTRPSGESVWIAWELYGVSAEHYRMSVAIDGDEVSASPWLVKSDPYQWARQYEREDLRIYAELLERNGEAS